MKNVVSFVIIILLFFKPNVRPQEEDDYMLIKCLVEVKAKNGKIYNSTSSSQISGHIDNLSKQGYLKPRLAIVTTSNVEIAPSVKTQAITKRIALIHIKAQYKMLNGKMLVRFNP